MGWQERRGSIFESGGLYPMYNMVSSKDEGPPT